MGAEECAFNKGLSITNRPRRTVRRQLASQFYSLDQRLHDVLHASCCWSLAESCLILFPGSAPCGAVKQHANRGCFLGRELVSMCCCSWSLHQQAHWLADVCCGKSMRCQMQGAVTGAGINSLLQFKRAELNAV
jgi:hypothetical protein